MKLRLIEIECEGAQALEMVRELAGLAQTKAAPPAMAPRALPAPARPREAKTLARPKAEAKDDGQGPRGKMVRLALEGLAEGPKTSRELAEWIQQRGHQYDKRTASSLLTYMRVRGYVRRQSAMRGGKWEIV